MAVDHIRYDLLTQQALRGVVRGVLVDAARKGLPGEHHFYISFDTNAPGVRLSPRLHSQHPEEMTIVLQHQFWDLIVNDDGFEVGLSFGGIPERIGIPFAAIKGFFDPSVQFGLQFEMGQSEASSSDDQTSQPLPGQSGTAETAKPQSAPVAAPEKTPAGTAQPAAAAQAPVAAASASAEPDKPSGSGEVVRLDRYRKK